MNQGVAAGIADKTSEHWARDMGCSAYHARLSIFHILGLSQEYVLLESI